MKESLNSLCERFVENTDVLYKIKGFKFTNSKMMPLCAYTFAASGQTIDPDDLQSCLKLVEASGGVFSCLRDANQAVSSCIMSVSNDPEGTLNAA
ncbi:MAG: DUF4003 domain-containing protein, partial [Ruminococcus sp.]|nr:DUF4003 domain-containing protein [Ruminococcus sp.]